MKTVKSDDLEFEIKQSIMIEPGYFHEIQLKLVNRPSSCTTVIFMKPEVEMVGITITFHNDPTVPLDRGFTSLIC